jgi:hypothetical protein
VDILELADVIALLRSEVAKAGNQRAWANRTGLDRTVLNQILRGRRPPTPHVIELLKLRVVFTPLNGSQVSQHGQRAGAMAVKRLGNLGKRRSAKRS